MLKDSREFGSFYERFKAIAHTFGPTILQILSFAQCARQLTRLANGTSASAAPGVTPLPDCVMLLYSKLLSGLWDQMEDVPSLLVAMQKGFGFNRQFAKLDAARMARVAELARRLNSTPGIMQLMKANAGVAVAMLLLAIDVLRYMMHIAQRARNRLRTRICNEPKMFMLPDNTIVNNSVLRCCPEPVYDRKDCIRRRKALPGAAGCPLDVQMHKCPRAT